MKRAIRTIKHWLRVLRTPSCWQLNYPVSKAWDRRLNEMLDAPHFSHWGAYTVRLNGVVLWVGNYPYAYGNRWRDRSEVMPSRRTIFRLHDAIERADLEQLETSRDKAQTQKEEEWPEYITGSWR